MTLDHEEPISTAIEALEATIQGKWTGLVLAKISREGEQLSVTPVTLFGLGDPVDLSLWQRPWNTREIKVRDWFERLRLKRTERSFAVASRTATDAAIAAAWRMLLDRVEAGPGLADTLAPGLAAHAERLDSFGLPTLAWHLRNVRQGAGILTAAHALSIAHQQRCAVPLLV